MTLFRPCIDLHNGQVKQIVGGSLSDDESQLKTNFVSEKDAAYYANLYAADALTGGHVIQLGPGNLEAATAALKAYPDGLQIGGGITNENALSFLDAGASHVIVTSWLFENEDFSLTRLEQLSDLVGKERLVLDLSCRRTTDGWVVAMNRWQTLTSMSLSPVNLSKLASYCDEFLIHAADVEGKCEGIDEDLVVHLGRYCEIPVTYAGGVKSLSDLALVDKLSEGRVDLTIGSALDIFGGSLIAYTDCVTWNREHEDERS
ncbi:MAG: phosphoribosylformimino-5-aminoimidazole carboxamide ribotide isomerase [Lentisphaeria bacterium]|nr:phosphoribosylformimino-5-aminoimidazole carboxamide ribotide isomerase [Lentisphaeria bacterium]